MHVAPPVVGGRILTEDPLEIRSRVEESHSVPPCHVPCDIGDRPAPNAAIVRGNKVLQMRMADEKHAAHVSGEIDEGRHQSVDVGREFGEPASVVRVGPGSVLLREAERVDRIEPRPSCRRRSAESSEPNPAKEALDIGGRRIPLQRQKPLGEETMGFGAAHGNDLACVVAYREGPVAQDVVTHIGLVEHHDDKIGVDSGNEALGLDRVDQR